MSTFPDNYKINSSSSSISNYELEQIRKRLLSKWLANVSSHRIDRECKLAKFNSSSTTTTKKHENTSYLNSIFSMLTGNRIIDACLFAIDNKDYRLALLLSQGGGGCGNDKIRQMIKNQLDEWSTSNSDKYINVDMLKFYVLISGDLTYNFKSNNSHLINLCENLDWKRQFSLVLWYNCLPIHSIHDALILYEENVKNEIQFNSNNSN